MDGRKKLKPIPVSDLCALDQCPVGSECEICRINGDAAERLRLLNLGFHRKSRVRLVQVRNDNYIVCVDGSRFALSKDLANKVAVQLKQGA